MPILRIKTPKKKFRRVTQFMSNCKTFRYCLNSVAHAVKCCLWCLGKHLEIMFIISKCFAYWYKLCCAYRSQTWSLFFFFFFLKIILTPQDTVDYEVLRKNALWIKYCFAFGCKSSNTYRLFKLAICNRTGEPNSVIETGCDKPLVKAVEKRR